MPHCDAALTPCIHYGCVIAEGRVSVGVRRIQPVRLQSHNCTRRLQHCHKMEYGLTQKQVDDYSEIFRKFDQDGDGQIDARELASVLSEFSKSRVTEQRASRIIADNDTNKNGTIEINEFIAFMSAMVKVDTKFKSDTRMKQMFKQFDKNGDGKITPDELKAVLKDTCPDITDSQIRDMVTQADSDGDGKIDYNEFVAMMK
ncbi:calmodulin-A-like [Haliotis rubra]|uniref:calmodulin-A-like n=1 Tax=Haliotis rubra TaxID=36100 RepID=UPI001EE5562D|nr:calmodulin-A-like [Haliotis rubra]